MEGAGEVVARPAVTETKVFPAFPAPSNLAFVRALARVARCSRLVARRRAVPWFATG